MKANISGRQVLKESETKKGEDYLSSYREHLVLAEQKAQEDYDKTVVTLSGGALGVSFAFLEKVIGNGPAATPKLLFFSQLCWAVSIASVLISYFLSRLALRRTIQQVDADNVHLRRPGGWMSLATETFNILSGTLFVAGVVVAAIFVLRNMRI